MIMKWNDDKPHRCPGCYAVAVTSESPSPWSVYTCCRCGARFTKRPALWRLLRDAGVACQHHDSVRAGVLDEMSYRFLELFGNVIREEVPGIGGDELTRALGSDPGLATIHAVLTSTPGGKTVTAFDKEEESK